MCCIHLQRVDEDEERAATLDAAARAIRKPDAHQQRAHAQIDGRAWRHPDRPRLGLAVRVRSMESDLRRIEQPQLRRRQPSQAVLLERRLARAAAMTHSAACNERGTRR